MTDGFMLNLVVLAVVGAWAGANHWWSARRKSEPFSLPDLVCDISFAVFAMWFFSVLFAEWLKLSSQLTWALSALAAHNAPRSIFLADRYWLRPLLKAPPQEQDVIEEKREVASDEAQR